MVSSFHSQKIMPIKRHWSNFFTICSIMKQWVWVAAAEVAILPDNAFEPRVWSKSRDFQTPLDRTDKPTWNPPCSDCHSDQSRTHSSFSDSIAPRCCNWCCCYHCCYCCCRCVSWAFGAFWSPFHMFYKWHLLWLWHLLVCAIVDVMPNWLDSWRLCRILGNDIRCGRSCCI